MRLSGRGTRVMFAGAVAIVFAAVPTKGLADSDLSTLLAPPPGSDWIAAGPTPTTLSGPFSAHDYAVYLNSSGPNDLAAEGTLSRLGFRAGYAGLWEQRATYNLLIERVFAFADSQGANLWYTTLRRQALASKDNQGDVGTLDIPNSYGVDLEASTGIHSYRVGFVKGNVMFVVHADAPAGSDLRVMAVQQAEAEYENAPASVTARPAQSSQSATSSMLAAGGAILGGALLIALVVATAAIAISRRSADPLS